MMLDHLFDALALPDSARMERRVPKAMLADHGATGAGDRKLVEGGIERLRWRASLKPGTIGVSAFADDTRDYSEIAVLTLEVREGANAARLAKIAHGAIPYPLILIIGDADAGALSVAPKRRHERLADHFVAERLVTAPPVTGLFAGVAEAFLTSLAVAQLPTANLLALYKGVIERAESYAAARITGAFRLPGSDDEAQRRRLALRGHADRSRFLTRLRKQVGREQRLAERLSLARQIALVEIELQSSLLALN